MIEAIGWAGSLLAIMGACLNARCLRVGFIFYIASNIILMSVGWWKGELYNVCLFATFLLIASYGYVRWGRRRPW